MPFLPSSSFTFLTLAQDGTSDKLASYQSESCKKQEGQAGGGAVSHQSQLPLATFPCVSHKAFSSTILVRT